MALNLSDPGAIVAAYESIVDSKNKHNWLLLKYSSYDELFLCDHGCNGLAELKSKIHDLDRVFIAFYRQEVDVEPGFILINYVPPSISGVKRARALVHSRRIGTVFKKHQTTLTVDDISKLTADTINQALDPEMDDSATSSSSVNSLSSQTGVEPIFPQGHDPAGGITMPSRAHHHQVDSPPSSVGSPPRVIKPSRPSTAPNQPSPRQPANNLRPAQVAQATSPPVVPMNLPPHSLNSRHDSLPIAPVRRAFSESEPIQGPVSGVNPGTAPLPLAKSSSMFSSLMGRNKKKDTFPENGPPPLPPKDFSPSPVMQHRQLQQSPPQPHVDLYSSYPPPGRGNDSSQYPPNPRPRSRTGSLSEFAIIPDPAQEDSFTPAETAQYVPLKGKWAPQGPFDYEERMRQLQEERSKREEAERLAREEEMRLAAERRRRKEKLEREQAEEEARKKAALEEEMQRIAREKARMERREKEAEERKRREIEARRQIDRDRRAEEHRKLEAWRQERKRMEEEAARRAEEARRKEETERRRKIQLAEAKVKRDGDVESMIAGWVTIQNGDSLTWKRRYFKFMGTAAYFYRNPLDTHEYLDKIEIRGRLKGTREWNQGYEELESIPHSFAVEFNDGAIACPMYADTEEEKYKILGLIHHAAGL